MSDNTILRQEDSSTVTKSWYSPLSQLQINSGNNGNRVSPLINTKRVSSSLSIRKNVTTPTAFTPSITHIFKRMTRNSTIRATSSNVSKILRKKGGQQHQQQQHQQQQQGNQGVRIYMKSPHVVANGELSGTIILNNTLNDDNLKNIQLSLIGLEEVTKGGDQYQFLSLEIFNMTLQEVQSLYNTQNDMIEIPFSTTLSHSIGGSFENERASVKYHLKSQVEYNDEKTSLISNTPVLIYPNFTSLRTNNLNLPVVEVNKQVWKSSTTSFVSTDISLSRSVWMSGAPIYVTVNIHNATTYTVNDMKLGLIRRQNICRIGEEDATIPIDSSCETIAETSLSNLGWWYPLASNRKDQVTLAVEAPANQVSVRNQKFIDVSFFIKLSITSNERTDSVTEIPIVLAHPIAMNPPPSLLPNNDRFVNMSHIPRITLSDNNEQTAASIVNSPSTQLSDIDEVSTPVDEVSTPVDETPLRVNTLDIGYKVKPVSLGQRSPMSGYNGKAKSVSMNNLPSIQYKSSPVIRFHDSSRPRPLILSTESIASSLHSTLNSAEPIRSSFHSTTNQCQQFRPLIRSYTTSSSKKLSKVKRSFSSWGNLISRRMSMSNINKRDNKSSRPEISSPIMSNCSISDESIASSLHSSPTSSTNHDVISTIHRNSREAQPQRSIMKFGQIKGPKKFGQQPGSLGDAGLDIRKCFNVATVTEAIQSFAAEKVEIPDDIPFYSDESTEEEGEHENSIAENRSPEFKPVQLTENNFKWKEGFVAPNEKCEFDMSMVDTDGELRRGSFSKYPFQQEGTTKRMLASSRHLQHLQRSGAQQQLQDSSTTVLPPSSV